MIYSYRRKLSNEMMSASHSSSQELTRVQWKESGWSHVVVSSHVLSLATLPASQWAAIHFIQERSPWIWTKRPRRCKFHRRCWLFCARYYQQSLRSRPIFLGICQKRLLISQAWCQVEPRRYKSDHRLVLVDVYGITEIYVPLHQGVQTLVWPLMFPGTRRRSTPPLRVLES